MDNKESDSVQVNGMNMEYLLHKRTAIELVSNTQKVLDS